MGSCVCSTSANTPVSSMISMSTPPAAPSGFLRMNRTMVVAAESRRTLRAVAVRPIGAEIELTAPARLRQPAAEGCPGARRRGATTATYEERRASAADGRSSAAG
jgi:hypothetical protein